MRERRATVKVYICKAVRLKAESWHVGWKRTNVGSGRAKTNFGRNCRAKSNGQENTAPAFGCSANLKKNQANSLDRPSSRARQIVPSQRFARGVCRAIPGDNLTSREWCCLALLAFRAAAQRHFGPGDQASAPHGLDSHRCRCLRQPLVSGMPHHAVSPRISQHLPPHLPPPPPSKTAEESVGSSPISSNAGARAFCDAPSDTGRNNTSGVARWLACSDQSPQVQGSRPWPAGI